VLCNNIRSVVDADRVNNVEILAKASGVLNTLERESALTVAQIAASVGEPVSSTYRLIRSLQALGWVEPGTRRGLYRLGVYVMQVSGLVESRLDLQQIALPVLQHLAQETRLACCLFVRRRLRSVCIEMAEDYVIRRFSLRVGDSLPINVGSVGAVLFSFLPRSERASVVSSLDADYLGTRTAGAVLRQLESNVPAVRARGFAIDRGETTSGAATVSAPIFNHRGELEAALAVSGLRRDIEEVDADTVSTVTATAAEIAHGLGASSPESAGIDGGAVVGSAS
jgi:DNA-binding IclR family transcriptional regulator